MEDCIFCQIIGKKIPAKEVYRDSRVVAFYDISPKAPVHILLVPVEHISSLIDSKDIHQPLLGELMLRLKKIAEKLNLHKKGYKVVINNGEASGQLVFHLHLHLLGGWQEKSHWQV